jgi:hypothetical protein
VISFIGISKNVSIDGAASCLVKEELVFIVEPMHGNNVK